MELSKIQINDDREDGKGVKNKDKSKKIRKKRSPAVDILIKTLIVCAIIDIPLFVYFCFIKDYPEKKQESEYAQKHQIEPSAESLNKLREQEEAARKRQDIATRALIKATNDEANNFRNFQYINQNEPEQQTRPQKKGRVIYSWINENGQKSFSNIGFPKDGKYTDGKIDWY